MTYDEIKDIIRNYEKSFTISELAGMTGISYHATSSHLIKLVSEGEILQIDYVKHTKVFVSKARADML